MEGSISASVSTLRSLHIPMSPPAPAHDPPCPAVSLPSSPRSSALPSPPDSPASSAGSVSSFPSVSSSFFFSSAAASPPHPASTSDASTSDAGLIIPSLTLPDALPRPTQYGQTLGELRILVLGDTDNEEGYDSFVGALVHDNEDVVEAGPWEAGEHGSRVLRVSTDWIEHRDAHGLEKFEPTRNVEIVRVAPMSTPEGGNLNYLITILKSLIHAPFHAIADVLHPTHQPSPVVANLVSSHSTPLYLALIMLVDCPSSPTPPERTIIDSLHPHVPIILLPSAAASPSPSSYPSSNSSSRCPSSRGAPAEHDPSPSHPPLLLRAHTEVPRRTHLSSFTPGSTPTLRAGLFRNPESLALLRAEAGDRFLRWREVERGVDGVLSARAERSEIDESEGRWWIQAICDQDGESEEGKNNITKSRSKKGKWAWDQARWEAEWMGNLSLDVARRVREREREGKKTQERKPQQKQRRERERGGTITMRRRSGGTSAAPPLPFVPLPHPESESDSDDSHSSQSQSPSPTPSSSRPPSPHLHPNANPLPLTPTQPSFDPLHLPSLLLYSLSLLGPLKKRLGDTLVSVLGYTPSPSHPLMYAGPLYRGEMESEKDAEKDRDGARQYFAYYARDADPRLLGGAKQGVRGVVGMALFGGFCLGVGVGVGVVLYVRGE